MTTGLSHLGIVSQLILAKRQEKETFPFVQAVDLSKKDVSAVEGQRSMCPGKLSSGMI